MNVSLVFNKVYSNYGLDQIEMEKIRGCVLNYVEPMLLQLYEKYSFEARSPGITNKILIDLKKMLFGGMTDVKLVLRQPKDERLDLGSILNHCRLKIDNNELLLNDYIMHLIIIQNNKAFIQIK
jgi:hypothetical protein